jgi:antitoxin MazE
MAGNTLSRQAIAPQQWFPGQHKVTQAQAACPLFTTIGCTQIVLREPISIHAGYKRDYNVITFSQMTIRTKIVRIGNSQGLRLSKSLLDESGISGEVEVTARNGEIVIHGVRSPRMGWDNAFSNMATDGNDTLLDPEIGGSDWDESDWEWE